MCCNNLNISYDRLRLFIMKLFQYFVSKDFSLSLCCLAHRYMNIYYSYFIYNKNIQVKFHMDYDGFI